MTDAQAPNHSVAADYTVLISALGDEDGGGWLALVPDLPGCSSDGDTREEALHNVRDAIRQWIATAEKHGHPVPARNMFVSTSFASAIPDALRNQIDDFVRQLTPVGQAPDPALIAAIF
jgi:antitoxin HicB